MSDSLKIFKFDLEGNQGSPDWIRLAMVDSDKHIMYIAAALFDCYEQMPILFATSDKIETVRYEGHGYIPISWAANFYEQARSFTEILESKLWELYKKNFEEEGE